MDQLPTGVTLTGIKYENTNLNIKDNVISPQYDIWVDGGKLNINGTVESGENGQILRLEITKKDYQDKVVQIPYRSEFNIYYVCKINPGILENMNLETYKQFTNNVSMKQDDKEFTDSHTIEVNYDKAGTTKEVVDKNGKWNNDARLLEYSIVLNPEGRDLLAGSDYLILADRLQYELNENNPEKMVDMALLPGTVKLYEAVYDSQGNLVKGNEITDWNWKLATSVNNNIHTHEIIANVPDGKAMIFEYDYNVWLPEGSKVDEAYDWQLPTISNTAQLFGDSNHQDGSWSKVEWKDSQTAGGITSDHAYILYKVEKGNYGKLLKGATFSLYKNSNPKQVLKEYTTNDSGAIIIEWHDDEDKYPDEFKFEYNTLYYIQETKAPDGYLLPEEPQKYYFYFSNGNFNSITPDGAIDLTQTAGQVYCENERSTTSIEVDKKWIDEQGNDVTDQRHGSVSVDLYQRKSLTPPTDEEDELVKVSVKIGKYDVDSVILFNQTYSCRKGTKICLDIPSNFMPKVVNGNNISYGYNEEIKPVSKSGENPTVYHYEYVVNGNVTISGITSDNSNQIITVNVNQPDIPEKPQGSLVGTYTINSSNAYGSWKIRIDNLPKKGITNGQVVYYSYYVKEHNEEAYNAQYNNNQGIDSGVITITNTTTNTPEYELPETGGMGTTFIYVSGALLVLLSISFLYKRNRI